MVFFYVYTFVYIRSVVYIAFRKTSKIDKINWLYKVYVHFIRCHLKEVRCLFFSTNIHKTVGSFKTHKNRLIVFIVRTRDYEWIIFWVERMFITEAYIYMLLFRNLFRICASLKMICLKYLPLDVQCQTTKWRSLEAIV